MGFSVEEVSKYGVEIYDSQGKMHSLSEIMSGLISAFQSLNQKQHANLSKMIAGNKQFSVGCICFFKLLVFLNHNFKMLYIFFICTRF